MTDQQHTIEGRQLIDNDGQAWLFAAGQWHRDPGRDVIPQPDDSHQQDPYLVRYWGARQVYERVDDPTTHWYLCRDGDDWLPGLYATLHAAWAAFSVPRETLERVATQHCALGADYSGRWKGRPLTIEDIA